VLLPLFCRVIVCDVELPVATEPKFTDVGEKEMPGCTPVPLRLIEALWPFELVTVAVPVTAPADAGWN